jgi:hypothetical protein
MSLTNGRIKDVYKQISSRDYRILPSAMGGVDQLPMYGPCSERRDGAEFNSVPLDNICREASIGGCVGIQPLKS